MHPTLFTACACDDCMMYASLKQDIHADPLVTHGGCSSHHDMHVGNQLTLCSAPRTRPLELPSMSHLAVRLLQGAWG